MIKVLDFYSVVHYCMYHGASQEELEYLVKSGNPRKLVFLIDSKPYWRSDLHPEYKGNRKPCANPDYFREVVQMAHNLNIESYKYAGLEADDLAGLVCHFKKLRNNKEPLVLFTVDSDWLQLVDDDYSITWRTPRDSSDYGFNNEKVISRVLEHDGNLITHPSQIATIKYIQGDKSDNIYPNMEYDLVSLGGQSWLNSLQAMGYNLNELERLISPIFTR